jgi:hypothetical protein
LRERNRDERELQEFEHTSVQVHTLVSANMVINKLMYLIADNVIANKLTNLIISLSKYSILNLSAISCTNFSGKIIAIS